MKRRLSNLSFAFLLRRMIFGSFLVLAVFSIAAAKPDSTALAVNIATIALTILVPFLPLAQFHLDGKRMVAVSMVVAFLIAVVANFITGDLKLADLSGSMLPLFIKFTLVWAGTQAVFQTFKDHPSVGPLLTDKPLLAAPPAPAPAK